METPARRPLVWAHRGACRQAPENTVAAFTLAERLGADGIELDAQLCASGEVIVFHDESLGRTTDSRGSSLRQRGKRFARSTPEPASTPGSRASACRFSRMRFPPLRSS